jgi:hypothetical protein
MTVNQKVSGLSVSNLSSQTSGFLGSGARREGIYPRVYTRQASNCQTCGSRKHNDPEVYIFIDIIVKGLNRDGYKFIGLVREPTQPTQQALAIVLEIGSSAEELRKIELHVDDTIMAAKPHVLIGPGVWELCG